jgi:hypothetical protein
MNPPEFQLLAQAARTHPDAKSVRDLVAKGVDWQKLLTLAARNGVRPILLQTLKSVCWDSVPNEIKLQLTLFSKDHVQKSLHYTRELLQLIALFEERAIKTTVFKGPVLAHTLYRKIYLREFSDLDMLVDEEDLSKAEDILITRGYQADYPDKDFRFTFLGYQGQYAFRHAETGVSVDLHWRLTDNYAPSICPGLAQVVIAGRAVSTLAPDDLALFLARHGTKEGWASLIWVCDFAELLRKCQDINWIGVLDRAQRSHSLRPLLLAIALASTLLDAPAPGALIDRAWKSSAVRALAEEAKLRMLSAVPEDEVGAFLKGLKTHDRLRHRLWTIAAHLTTRTVGDYRAMPLPKFLWGIYYLTRPLRLSIKVAALMPWGKNKMRGSGVGLF